MIECAATNTDGYTVTVHRTATRSPTGHYRGWLGTRTRDLVGDPDGDYLCCGLTDTEQARLTAAVTDGRRSHDD